LPEIAGAQQRQGDLLNRRELKDFLLIAIPDLFQLCLEELIFKFHGANLIFGHFSGSLSSDGGEKLFNGGALCLQGFNLRFDVIGGQGQPIPHSN